MLAREAKKEAKPPKPVLFHISDTADVANTRSSTCPKRTATKIVDLVSDSSDDNLADNMITPPALTSTNFSSHRAKSITKKSDPTSDKKESRPLRRQAHIQAQFRARQLVAYHTILADEALKIAEEASIFSDIHDLDHLSIEATSRQTCSANVLATKTKAAASAPWVGMRAMTTAEEKFAEEERLLDEEDRRRAEGVCGDGWVLV